MKSQTALLIDGTALYFAGTQRHERFDLEKLHKELLTRAQVKSWSPALFFSVVDYRNEKQIKFHDFLRAKNGWEIEEAIAWEADPIPPSVTVRNSGLIRFDPKISFALGRLMDRRNRIIVVSDSFGLAVPMSAAAACKHCEIVLAFFGQQLDTRWYRIFKESNIVFWNLDDMLFVDPQQERKPSSLSSLF